MTTTTTKYAAKAKALAEHLWLDEGDVTPVSQRMVETCFSVSPKDYAEQEEYRVFTDEEANAYAQEEIHQSLWAFNASFLLEFIGCREPEAHAAFSRMQNQLCENANSLVAAMIGEHRMEAFVAKVIAMNGRGNLLAQWDGTERKHGDFYIYRVR